MKILFDIVHPANIYFFYHPAKMLEQAGHEVYFAGRDKDVVKQLLEQSKFQHEIISVKKDGIVALAKELVERDMAMYKLVKKLQPDLLVGFGGVAISHVGKLLKIPAIAFYDTEVAKLQNFLSFPLLKKLYVPKSYTGSVPLSKTEFFNGYKELSFLHPKFFKPNKKIAVANGIDPKLDNFLIRLVKLKASHDFGKMGIDDKLLAGLIKKLAPLGNIIIVSERKVPKKFQKFCYQGDPFKIHHVMANCRMVIGDSATMSMEAAILGVPAIYACCDYRGYINDLANSYALIEPVKERSLAAIADAIDEIMQKDKSYFIENKNMLLEEKEVMAEYIFAKIMENAKSK